jgi:hypothetical protein
VYRFKFPDRFLNDRVVQACHALSIDDERHSFHPLVWNEGKNGDRIEQVWFAGVHSNVGGGYPKQGMSLVALDWMMAKAEAAGLRFNPGDRELLRDHASVDDKLYDSRAGLGTFYRWKPRDIAAICRANAMDPPRLHVSVLERMAHGTEDYSPANLPPKAILVNTPPDRHERVDLLAQRAANLEEVFTRALKGTSLLDALRGSIVVGRLSYYVFLIACTVAAAAAIRLTADGANAMALVRGTIALIGGIASSPIDTGWSLVRELWTHPAVFWGIVAAVAVSSIMSRIADGRVSDVSSEFWHTHQPVLRQALKEARADTLETRNPPISGATGHTDPSASGP